MCLTCRGQCFISSTSLYQQILRVVFCWGRVDILRGFCAILPACTASIPASSVFPLLVSDIYLTFSASPLFLFRMVEYSLDLQNINLSAIRTVRVLRPLKAINRVPSKSTCLNFLLAHRYTNAFFFSFAFLISLGRSGTWGLGRAQQLIQPAGVGTQHSPC